MSRRKKIINESDIPQHVIDSLARCLWPDILASYEDEEERRKLAEWQAQRTADTDIEDT